MFDKQTKEFCSAVVDALPDISEDVMQGWIGNPRGLKKVLKDVLCPTEEVTSCPKKGITAGAFSLTINSALTAEERITAGNYVWWNRDLLNWRREDQSIYTGTDNVSVSVELLHFNRAISTDEASVEMDRQSYRPANFEELTAFGEQYPDEQRKYPIIALGSVFVGPGDHRASPFLYYGSDARRGLGLRWHDFDWGGSCRFLVVRK